MDARRSGVWRAGRRVSRTPRGGWLAGSSLTPASLQVCAATHAPATLHMVALSPRDCYCWCGVAGVPRAVCCLQDLGAVAGTLPRLLQLARTCGRAAASGGSRNRPRGARSLSSVAAVQAAERLLEADGAVTVVVLVVVVVSTALQEPHLPHPPLTHRHSCRARRPKRRTASSQLHNRGCLLVVTATVVPRFTHNHPKQPHNTTQHHTLRTPHSHGPGRRGAGAGVWPDHSARQGEAGVQGCDTVR
jgi:hypothetical protein